jgi:hypothetical protein
VGRNRCGNWVVVDSTGLRGGLFIDQAQALRFVRAESGNHPQAIVLVDRLLELDMNRASVRPSAVLICNAQKQVA